MQKPSKKGNSDCIMKLRIYTTHSIQGWDIRISSPSPKLGWRTSVNTKQFWETFGIIFCEIFAKNKLLKCVFSVANWCMCVFCCKLVHVCHMLQTSACVSPVASWFMCVICCKLVHVCLLLQAGVCVPSVANWCTWIIWAYSSIICTCDMNFTSE